jgi:hypothetical protein
MADVVSSGEAFSSTDARREVWPVVAECAVGTALLSPGYAKPGVAYTNSGGHTRSDTNSAAPATISGIPDGGVGLDALQCSVATDGTYEFAVATAVATPGSQTPNGTAVYAIVSGGRITGLTLVATANTFFGTVNNPQDYAPNGTTANAAYPAIACVKIGG